MVLLGIDIGSEQCRMSHCGRGGIRGILNEESRRETPSLVQFTHDRRNIGPMAATQLSTHALNTVQDVGRFIGLKRSQIPDEHINDLTCKTRVTENDDLLFCVNYLGKPFEFTATEILGMLLCKLKSYALKETKSKDNDIQAVIAIPAAFTDPQRRAVQAAAKMAQIKLLKLIPSTTASALEYGLYKDDLPKEKPKYLAFVESGHTQTTVSIIGITYNKVRVKATAYDRQLGGRDFEDILFNHFANFIKENYPKNKGGLDVRASNKTTQILRKACQKVKTSLSATNIVQHQIEMITGSSIHDITLKITREEFDEMSKDLLQRFEVPVNTAFQFSGLKVEDISEVVVLGGTTYIPAIREILQGVFKKPVSTSVNVMESVSRGAAIQAAMLSPLIRLAKEFTVYDSVVHPVDLRWNKTEGITNSPVPDNPKKLTIFSRGEDRGAIFKSKFTKSKPFEIYAFYDETCDLPPNTNNMIGRYAIHLNTNQPTKVTVRMGFGLAGDFKVLNAFHEVEEEYEVEVEVEEDPMDTSDDLPTENGSNDEKSDEKKAEEKKQPKKIKKKVKKTRIKEVNLKVETYSDLLIPNQLVDRWVKEELERSNQDDLVRRTEDAKNSVETYSYETKDRVEYEDSELYPFLEENVRENFVTMLDDTVDWLYGDGEHEKLAVYTEKLTELRKIGDPAQRRFLEAQERPSRISQLNDKLQMYSEFVVSTDENYSHIGEEERKKVSDKVNQVSTWLNEELSKQNSLPLYENPSLTVQQLEEKLNSLVSTCQPILETPIPKPEEKMEDEKPDETKKADTPQDSDDKMEDEQKE